MFWLLAAYGAATVVSALELGRPGPEPHRLQTAGAVPDRAGGLSLRARSPRARLFATVIISVGAISALIGIVQYGVLHYDNLGRRPQGALTHYMTYSGVLMLVACAAARACCIGRDHASGAHCGRRS